MVGIAVVIGAVLATTASATRSPEPSGRRGAHRAHGPRRGGAAHTVAPPLRRHPGGRAADLAFQAAGRLAQRPVQVGDRVEAGARLARLDPAPQQHAARRQRARIARLDAELAQAGRDLDRLARLSARDAATTQALEQARTGVAALEAGRREAAAGLAEARRQRTEADLVAPFAGTVVAVYAEVGELVAPGRPVVALAGAGGLEVAIEVPETVVADLHPGMAADVFFPLLDQQVTATVSQVGADAAGAGRLFAVLVALPDDAPLRAGLTAEVVLATPRPAGLAVPLAAVVDPAGGRPRVFRVQDGVARRVPVVVAELADGGRVVITGSGGEGQAPLQADDAVVVGGHFALLDGDPVARVEAPR
ncbi:MAG: efflux RND transporter periplasmic adaptor subunit [bacterium]